MLHAQHSLCSIARANAPLMKLHGARCWAKKSLIVGGTSGSAASFRGAAAVAVTLDKSYSSSQAALQRQLPSFSWTSSIRSELTLRSFNTLISYRRKPATPLTPNRPSPTFARMSTASSAAVLVEQAKKAAAVQAVENHLLPSHRYVGIGSGSTVVYVVEAIVAKGPEFYQNMTFIPTGSQSKGLIRTAGLKLANLDERPVVDGRLVQLDACFDGADEVDEDLNLIKGGGACLFQEKLVAVAARTFVAVAGKYLASINTQTPDTNTL